VTPNEEKRVSSVAPNPAHNLHYLKDASNAKKPDTERAPVWFRLQRFVGQQF